MGKLKKGRRNQKKRLNPLAREGGLVSKQEAKEENMRQTKIVPLISKLSSSAPNDRSVALSAITVLAEDTGMRKLLLKEKLVATVMEQTLNDSNDELVVESFGLLRNLTIEEGHDVAKFLWRSNIWAAIDSGLAKIEQSYNYLLTDPKKLDKKRTYLLYDFIENVLSLIVLIASCSEELYNNVIAKMDKVVPLAVQLLHWNLANPRTDKVFNSVLDFLYEFASDSTDFVISLANLPSFSLQKVVGASQLPAHESNKLGRIYAQGLCFHFLEVKGDDSSNKEQSCADILRSVFSTITAIDLQQLSQALAVTDNANEPIKKSETEKKPQDIDVPFGGVPPEKVAARANLQAIDISIDLYSSICEFLALNTEDPLEPVALSADMISLLLDLAHPTCLHLLSFDEEHDHVLHLTSKVLIAINNLCWLLLSNENVPVQWYNKIPELWLAIETVSSTDNLECQKLSLGILWALCKFVGPEIRDKVTIDNVRGLLAKCSHLTSTLPQSEDQVESLELLISAVGFLGSVAQVIGNVEITRQISEFLFDEIVHFLQPQNNMKDPKAIEIPLECLNLIYDIFGDAEFEYDLPVFVEGNYLAKLEEVEPAMKACFKQIDKKKQPELKVRAEAVWTTLGRFIEYKRSERR